MTPSLWQALGYEFMRHAVVAGLLASVLCGLVGSFVVVKRLTFVAGGISHAAFGGLGICFFLGAAPLAGAVVAAVAAALVLSAAETERLRRLDALIGVLWAVGMAVGIVFVYRTPGFAPNLMTYLFGNILLVSRGDLETTLALAGGVLAVLALFWKGFVAVAFDEELARVQGLPVRFLSTLLLVLVALTVVVLIQVVGILLVLALLTIPPLVALLFFSDLSRVLVASVGVGVAITLGGLAVSYYQDLPSGPAVILLGAVALGAAYAARALARRRRDA